MRENVATRNNSIFDGAREREIEKKNRMKNGMTNTKTLRTHGSHTNESKCFRENDVRIFSAFLRLYLFCTFLSRLRI